jgi:hypothetical protein
MKKSERMESLAASLEGHLPGFDRCYTGWFVCFNRAEYYEAHDVLEHLWLQTTDRNYAFYKGLIQLAGAFVHLKKQHARPWHPKDGARLRPAVRLFTLARNNLAPFAPRHLSLDVSSTCALCEQWIAAIEQEDYRINPWSPSLLPQVHLDHAAVE